MKYISIKEARVSAIAQGCMRIADMEVNALCNLMETLLENDINFWDHADIYGRGRSEEVFGQALKQLSGMREKLIIQSKCGIRPGTFTCYDFSKEHIITSVENSLRKMNTEYLDYLLLHRPDLLMDPEEVAEAFDRLYQDGKVRHFGVSNHTPGQIELLQKYINQPIEVNQLQFSLAHTLLLDAPSYLNTTDSHGVSRDAGVLSYCMLHDITIQCYSPFQYGVFEGTFLGNPSYKELNEVLERLAIKYNTTTNGIATAWILRHPANMQVVVGTTNVDRVEGIAKGADVVLTREEWYECYRAAGNKLP